MRFIKPLQAIASAAILLAVVCAMLYPALFQGKILAPLDVSTCLFAPWKDQAARKTPYNHFAADAVTQYLPYRVYEQRSFKEDGYIGWNPYETGGISLAGNTMALPGSWAVQIHRFLPFDLAWNLTILVEFLVAGSGMLVFLRSRKLAWLPALFGAVIYMANSQFVIWIYHRWALGSFCWMPWVLWSATGGLMWKKPDVRNLLLPVFLTMAILGGSLQHMCFVFLACSCLVLANVRSPKSAFQSVPEIMNWAVAYLIAVLLASFTLLPQITAYFHSTGVTGAPALTAYPQGIKQPFLNLIAASAQLWPWLMGDPQSLDGWRLLKSYFMNVAYFGTVPGLLAILGLWNRTMPRQAKFLVIAGLLIPLTPLNGILYHRVQLLYLLGGTWMAAEMLARLAAKPSPGLNKLATAMTAAAAILLLACTLVPQHLREAADRKIVAQAVAAAANSSLSSDPHWVEARAHLWVERFSLLQPRTAWVFGLLAVGMIGLAASQHGGEQRRRWGNIAVITVSALELLTFFKIWVTFADPSPAPQSHPAIERVKELAGTGRVWQCQDVVPFSKMFAPPNLLAASGVRTIDYYETIQTTSTYLLLRDTPPSERLTLAGVVLSVQPLDLPAAHGTENWPVIESLAGFNLRKNPHVLPPVVAGKHPIPGNSAELPQTLSQATAVAVPFATMNRWTLRIPPGSAWIRIAQNWHEGWRWQSGDGKWQPLLEGPDGACWIDSIPSGVEEIRLRFFPRPRFITLMSLITAAGWCLLTGSFAVRHYLHRQRLKCRRAAGPESEDLQSA